MPRVYCPGSFVICVCCLQVVITTWLSFSSPPASFNFLCLVKSSCLFKSVSVLFYFDSHQSCVPYIYFLISFSWLVQPCFVPQLCLIPLICPHCVCENVQSYSLCYPLSFVRVSVTFLHVLHVFSLGFIDVFPACFSM